MAKKYIDSAGIGRVITKLKALINGKANSNHTHPAQTTVSGNAGSATKLTSSAGSATQPVYFSDGKPVACTNTLAKSVPADAKFTDTTYSAMTAATSSAAGKAGLVPAPAAGKQTSFLRGDGTWVVPTNTTYSAAGSSLGLVKTGGDVTISSGVITVNDDSHAHTIANVDGLQTALDGKAATSHGTHVSFSTDVPKANGTAAVGTAATVARSDHVHPVQTTVSGNAGSATKLATARTVDGVSFNGSANITHYGTCSTAAATAAKTVALTGFTLAAGARVMVKFTVTNTAANPTLNVNSTGAKSIKYRGAAISAGYLAANRVYEFVYDGTNYERIGDFNTNTTYAVATTTKDGLMAKTDKAKLDGMVKSVSVTLAAASWSSNTQTAAATGVTASNTVIVSPAPDSREAYAKAGIACTAQAAGQLTFTCKTAPTAAVVVNVVILGG